MTVGSFVSWLLITLISAFLTCAMSAAWSTLMITIAVITMGLFFSPIMFAPYLMREQS